MRRARMRQHQVPRSRPRYPAGAQVKYRSAGPFRQRPSLHQRPQPPAQGRTTPPGAQHDFVRAFLALAARSNQINRLSGRTGRALPSAPAITNDSRPPHRRNLHFLGQTCALCKQEFAAGDEIVICPDDGSRHHVRCWQANGKIAPAYGCRGEAPSARRSCCGAGDGPARSHPAIDRGSSPRNRTLARRFPHCPPIPNAPGSKVRTLPAGSVGCCPFRACCWPWPWRLSSSPWAASGCGPSPIMMLQSMGPCPIASHCPRLDFPPVSFPGSKLLNLAVVIGSVQGNRRLLSCSAGFLTGSRCSTSSPLSFSSTRPPDKNPALRSLCLFPQFVKLPCPMKGGCHPILAQNLPEEL